MQLTLSSLIFFYVGEMAAFSICLYYLRSKQLSVTVWLVSNFVGILGMFFTGSVLGSGSMDGMAIGGALKIVGGCLKALALSDFKLKNRRNMIPNGLVIVSFVLAVIIFTSRDPSYRFLCILIAASTSLLATIGYLVANRRWLGLRPLGPIIVVLSLMVIISIVKLSDAYPIGTQRLFMDGSKVGIYNFLALCVLSFVKQLIFLVLILAQQERQKQMQANRTARVYTISEVLKAKTRESSALAEERYQLIKMLTHEVRQPLNTAQAALLSASASISQGQPSLSKMKQTLEGTQGVLNSIVLSISNSILGATLIAGGRRAALQEMDLCEIAHLALFDINPSDRRRIRLQLAQQHLFADADPIVLRLAIRNLLENAVKYSPAGSPIIFKIVADEDAMMASFQITNDLIDASMLDGDIFERHKRGADSSYGGYGLGLYIVNEVANLHHGDLSYNVVAGAKVVFQLKIPA